MTVAELADHEARVSTGDQPPSAVDDVHRARQLVVSSQVQTVSSSQPTRRRKRTVGGSGTFTAITAISDFSGRSRILTSAGRPRTSLISRLL